MNTIWRLSKTTTLAILVAIILCSPGRAQFFKGQAVTWSNFDYVYSVAASMSHVYFATTGGVTRYNKLENRWEEPLTGADGLDDQVAQRIWVDWFDRYVYIETTLGYYEYDVLFERWYPIIDLPDFDTQTSHVDPPDIFMPSFNANYMGQGRFIDTYGRSFLTSDILDDNTGTLWIGTWGFGAAKSAKSSLLMDLLPYGLLQNRVNTILADDTVMWVSGAVFNDSRTGLTAFNPEENSFFHVESGVGFSFPAVDVNCLAADRDKLYVGTPAGMYIVERGRWNATGPIGQRRGLADDNILALCCHDNLLFIGTAGGLNIIDIASDSIYQVHPQTFFNHIIYDLEPVGTTVWIASEVGAFRYRPESNKLQQYQDPNLILTSRVYDVASYGDFIWFASDAGVVNLNLQTAESTPFREVSIRFDSRALAVNDEIAAVASDGGLTLIFHDLEKPFSREFTTGDGLPSNVVYSLLMDGDYLWVGTDRGLTRFWWNNPNRID